MTKTPAAGASGQTLRFAMLGMIPGNGHPYSWSAIVNGYDPVAMAPCPYPSIPQYLGAQPLAQVKVPNAQVTHIWTDVLDEARLVAKASLIPHVVNQPEDVIGHVDAVFISTDDGYDHVRRARPFVEAGLPVFIDKPLAISIQDLQTFIDWEKGGAPILSSSGARYHPGLDKWETDRAKYGELRPDSWSDTLRDGFNECWRVLRMGGTLHFKWAEGNVPLKEVLKLFPIQPLFKNKHHVSWSVFAKAA